MNCTDIKALLSALIDDEMDAARRHEAERHLVECQSCRELLSHAERIDALIAADGESSAATTAISPGFEAAVLDRTVFAERRGALAQRWTTWGGWLAAAACLALAMTIWLVDQRAQRDRFEGANGEEAFETVGAALASSSSSVAQSWTFDDPQPAENFARILFRDEVRPGQALPQDGRRGELSLEDAETLYAAAILLDVLGQSDHPGPEDLERMRQIEAYDALLPRLAEMRGRVDRADRPAVLAVEWVLRQVADESLSVDELDELRQTTIELDLGQTISSMIGHRWDLEQSL